MEAFFRGTVFRGTIEGKEPYLSRGSNHPETVK
jgi:hypothetical protein